MPWFTHDEARALVHRLSQGIGCSEAFISEALWAMLAIRIQSRRTNGKPSSRKKPADRLSSAPGCYGRNALTIKAMTEGVGRFPPMWVRSWISANTPTMPKIKKKGRRSGGAADAGWP